MGSVFEIAARARSIAGKRRALSSARIAVVIVAALLIGGTRAFGLGSADLDPSLSYKLERIDLSGERAFSRAALLAVMTTKERPWYQAWKPMPKFDPRTFTDDLATLKRFYEARGYFGVRVACNLTLSGDKVTPHIRVSEGEPVRIAALEVEVTANSPQPRELDRSFKLPLKQGDVFREEAYQSGARDLLGLYTSHSYAHASVRRHAVIEVGALAARVRYEIEPGNRYVFGRTSIEGLEKVAPQIVERELTYKPGEPFDSRKLAALRNGILGLNLFSAVDIRQEKSPVGRDVVPIAILLHEGPAHSLSAGLGYNTQTQLNATLGWTGYDFLGNGRRLSVAGTYSNINSTFDVKLVQPHLLSPRASLTLEVSEQEQTYQTYTGNISGFDPHLDYNFSPALTAFVGWRLEYPRFNSVNSSTIAAIGGFRRQGILSGPSAGLTFNNTDDPFDPQGGEILSLLGNVSDHAFGADYRYWRVLSEARKYESIGWRTVLAARLEVGLSDTLSSIGDVPLSERFYSGGEGSVRGYGLRRIGPLSASNDPLGGLSLIEGSLELRRPLFWKLSGTLFFDCGQVATHPYDLRIDALQCGYGPAAGINSPVGPINFYLGFPTDKPHGDASWQFYFSIGQYF